MSHLFLFIITLSCIRIQRATERVLAARGVVSSDGLVRGLAQRLIRYVDDVPDELIWSANVLSLVIVSSRAIVPVAAPVLSAVLYKLLYKLDADRHRRASLNGLAPISPLVRPAPIPFRAPSGG